jgi:hypothetical protein
MPVGQPDYACQPRTDFVAETSDGYIYLCWVNNGLKVGRCSAGTTSWQIIDVTDNPDYDSPSIYIDGQDRIFIAARHFNSVNEDEIHLFTSTDGFDFGEPQTIFAESGTRVDPAYLTLKGDADDRLFLTFPYRLPGVGPYVAVMGAAPGGDEWTGHYVLTDKMRKHPALAIRPNGSLEVCYGYCTYPYYGINEGATDTPLSERNELWGRSHPGFQQ